jgi:hypothetical protein
VKQRGFLSLELILIAGAVAAASYGVWWLSGLRADRERAQQEAANATERAQRQSEIGDLTIALANTGQQLRDERTHNEALRLDMQRDREGHLHDFVPKTPAGAPPVITVGWVQYVNAAAAGVPLGVRPGPELAKTPAPVGADTVAALTGRNYDKYNGCIATVAGILKEFDTKRAATNEVIDRINQRLQRAERKVK